MDNYKAGRRREKKLHPSITPTEERSAITLLIAGPWCDLVQGSQRSHKQNLGTAQERARACDHCQQSARSHSSLRGGKSWTSQTWAVPCQFTTVQKEDVGTCKSLLDTYP